MRWLLLSILFAVACTNRAGGGKADAARGQKYFTMKCNACHPNGKQGAGPDLFGTGKRLPGPLQQSSSGGRHNIPSAEWDSLMLFLEPQFKGAEAPATPTTPVTPGAMKICACTCQCPADTPPGQMANCQCQCQCP